ncbi:MAG: SUMF1/EgtB/PvdO family nonheme iron enzyme [Candidatus Aminicenantes bacterium]|nr:SUMF1/EgtB/PvdO family nonheme iron enzyme [Candidatus Aminicenantes bacterium]
MSKINKLLISKFFALLLAFLLLYGPYAHGDNVKNLFKAGLEAYSHGAYKAAVEKGELLLSINETIDSELKAKAYLLIGAGFEKSGRLDAARETFLKLKQMLDEGLIVREPRLDQVDTASLTAYRKVFVEESFFQFKKPTAVTEIMRKNVVQAPRKSIAQKEKEKKKKNFPWLIAVGAVVIIGTAAVLLLTQKQSKRSTDPPSIEWVRIPAGEFLMGDNFNEGDADEQPVHKVYLDEYYISKYEINRQEYYAFCNATGRFFPDGPGGSVGISERAVYSISRGDAAAFCQWLSLVSGEKIDLPTEAQWEKAARGDFQYRYPWGNEPPDDTLALYGGNAWKTYYGGRFPAGASPYGVQDMAGNAAEWCRDRYSGTYYSVSPASNPTGPTTGTSYVVRGGSYNSSASGIRSAKRESRDAGYKAIDTGFRIVKR